MLRVQPALHYVRTFVRKLHFGWLRLLLLTTSHDQQARQLPGGRGAGLGDGGRGLGRGFGGGLGEGGFRGGRGGDRGARGGGRGARGEGEAKTAPSPSSVGVTSLQSQG